MKNKILNLSLIVAMLLCFSAFVFAEDTHGKAINAAPVISVQIDTPSFVAATANSIWTAPVAAERFDRRDDKPIQPAVAANYKTRTPHKTLSEGFRRWRPVKRE